MLREKLSPVNSCCGVSNEPVVNRLNCPVSGTPAKRFEARPAAASLLMPRSAKVPALGPSFAPAMSASGTVTSFKMPRRRWRSRHAVSLWSSSTGLAEEVGSSAGNRGASAGSLSLSVCSGRPMPAATIGRVAGGASTFGAAGADAWRTAIADVVRAFALTSTSCPRDAAKPLTCTRTR